MFFFALLTSILFSFGRVQAQSIVVGVGTSIDVPSHGARSVHVPNGRLLSVGDLGRTLRLTGKKAGVVSLTLDAETHLVSVIESAKWNAYERLRSALQPMLGLSLAVEDGMPIVRGRLLRLSDWVALSSAVGTGARYQFAAELDPLIADDVKTYVTDLIQHAGVGIPDLDFSPATVRVSSERKDLVARFEKLLGPYGFMVEASGASLTLEPLVRVQILVTEVRKKMMRRLGIAWPASIQAQLLPSFLPPGQGGQNLSVQLNALEESGVGRILASPNLLCRSGKEAEFLAGGEFPIKISSRKDASVVWKKYGVLLKIKPVADFSGRMSIGLETEVSTIDTSHTVDGLPGMLTNRIESHFDLRGSRTIALSGLIRNDRGDSSNGLPGLSGIPILGRLFSSKEFREENTELVVFVTPELVTDPGSSP